jgi:hypothetical protein
LDHVEVATGYGEVAEGLKAIDCKSIHMVFIGSNPIFSKYWVIPSRQGGAIG